MKKSAILAISIMAMLVMVFTSCKKRNGTHRSYGSCGSYRSRSNRNSAGICAVVRPVWLPCLSSAGLYIIANRVNNSAYRHIGQVFVYAYYRCLQCKCFFKNREAITGQQSLRACSLQAEELWNVIWQYRKYQTLLSARLLPRTRLSPPPTLFSMSSSREQ